MGLDAKFGGGAAIFSSTTGDDMLIEALAPLEGKSQYRRAVFRASMIDYLIEIEDRVSCIVMKSGGHIPVALPISELKGQIYEPDFRSGGGIDLTLVTGAAVEGVRAEFIARAFELMPKKPSVSQDFKIRAILRRPSSNDFNIETFGETDVLKYDVEDDTRAKQDESVAIYFNEAAKTTPFLKSAPKLYLDMRKDEFLKRVSAAKIDKVGILDLAELFSQYPSHFGFDPK